MIAEIICVGTELLLGDIVNTNAQFIAQQLSTMGISVYNQQVVGDNPDRLRQAAQLAKDRSDIVIYTGGLGPTDDDLTKQTVASVYNDSLEFNQKICDDIQDYFVRMGRTMTDNNKKQAFVPVKGHWLENNYGTAPGIVFVDGEKKPFRKVRVIFGKPYEPVYSGRHGTAEEQQKIADDILAQAYALGGQSVGGKPLCEK